MDFERSPYESACPTLFAEYSPTSEIGVLLRQTDARLRLREMAEVEEAIRLQEEANAEIADRLARQQAEHQCNMQYLLRFGVTAGEREQFQGILTEVAEHGGLSLKEAAQLARARRQSLQVQ